MRHQRRGQDFDSHANIIVTNASLQAKKGGCMRCTSSLRSKTGVSWSEAGASKSSVGCHKGCHATNDCGFYESKCGSSLRKADFAVPVRLLFGLPCRSQQAPAIGAEKSVLPDSQSIEAFPSWQQTDQQRFGTISGTVVDQSGARVTGALIKLVRQDELPGAEVLSDENGQFFFSNVAPGLFHLTIMSDGLAPQSSPVTCILERPTSLRRSD